MESLLGAKIKEKNAERAFSVLLCVVFALLILILAFNLTYKRVYVVGSSMNDTLTGAPDNNPQKAGGDFVYVFEGNPSRGDIVVIRTDTKTLIKRVIALGGDTVKIVDGKVYLNGVELSEPYVSADNNTSVGSFDEITVAEGCFYFLGDNRDSSNDSRNIGCLPVDSVIGIVAKWSLTFKNVVTAFNTFFEFTLPSWFGAK